MNYVSKGHCENVCDPETQSVTDVFVKRRRLYEFLFISGRPKTVSAEPRHDGTQKKDPELDL